MVDNNKIPNSKHKSWVRVKGEGEMAKGDIYARKRHLTKVESSQKSSWIFKWLKITPHFGGGGSPFLQLLPFLSPSFRHKISPFLFSNSSLSFQLFRPSKKKEKKSNFFHFFHIFQLLVFYLLPFFLPVLKPQKSLPLAFSHISLSFLVFPFLLLLPLLEG